MTWTGEDSDALDAQIYEERRKARRHQSQPASTTPFRLGSKGREPATDDQLKRRQQAARQMSRRT